MSGALKLFALMALLLSIAMSSSFGKPSRDNVLERKHLASGITCQKCHGEKTPHRGLSRGSLPTLATKEACLQCHGSYADLAKSTRQFEPPYNVHDSHWGPLDCYQCHRVHRTSELFCASCHVGLKLPPAWKARPNPADE